MNTELVEQLREEIRVLLTQNAELRQLVAPLRKQVAELESHLQAALERIAELEQDKKGPPSFVKPNKPKREKATPSRHQRAQEHNRGRKRAEEVTRHEEHRIEHCPECASKLYKKQVGWRRQVVDVPPPTAAEVTEHVVYKGYCPHCGAWKYATPHETEGIVGQRRLGARLMALIGYLSESLHMPYEAVQSYLKTMHGVAVSKGEIVALRCGLAKKLQPVAEKLKVQVQESDIVHADETGWREEGRNGYIWSFSTPGKEGIRYYVFDHSRGQQVVQAVLGESFQGVLVSDFYAAYNVYTGRHQRCWVHLVRDLHTLKEEHPEDDIQAWAKEVRALYDRGHTFVRAGPHSQEEREQLYLALVSEAERLGLIYAREEHPCRALAKRLLRHQDELFQFVLVAGLAADNNLAERSLRPLVVARKISGGTRSVQGSQTRMTLATIFATLKVRDINPFKGCLALIRTNSCP